MVLNPKDVYRVFFGTVFEKWGTPDEKTNSEKQLMTQ